MNILLLSLVVSALCSCSGYKYQHDNIIEESFELGIKYETGVDVDLSPSTPETGFTVKAIKPLVKD